MDRTHELKRLTSTGAVKAGPGVVSAVALAAGSDAAATVVLNDGLEGGGTDVLTLAAVTGGSATISFPRPVYFSVGIYATLAGSGAVLSIAYE